MLYVVELVVRTHHAVVYEMPTAAAPEKTIIAKRKKRPSSGKLASRLSEDQFSTVKLAITRTGMDSRLL